MKFLSERRVVFYATTNLILLLTNLVLFIFTYDNPLTMLWLMIVYFVLSIISVSYQVYIMIKMTVNQEQISKASLRFKVFDWTSFVLVPVSVFILVFGNLIVRGNVVQRSMEPTLRDGQSIIIYKFYYTPKRNDIVIILNDKEPNTEPSYIIKRVIALPGDIIEFREVGFTIEEGFKGRILINGEYFVSKADEETGSPSLFSYDEYRKMLVHQYDRLDQVPNKVTLSKGYYLALGDNFKNSADSRTLGAFHISKIGGKMIFTLGGAK